MTIVRFAGEFRVAEIDFTRDGEPWRECRPPGSDLSDLPDDVQKQIEAEWTPEIIAAYQEATKPEPPPPPPRRRVDRLTIIKRLDVLGLLDVAEKAIAAADPLTRWRWNVATDGVYADDEDTRDFLKKIGANPDAILAP